MNPLDRFLGDPSKVVLRRLQKRVEAINALEPDFQKLSDSDLRAKTEEFRGRLAKRMEKVDQDPLAQLDIRDKQREKKELNAALDGILPEAFAAVREAARRSVGQRHFDVQLLGGMVLHEGNIAEMRTGEGKTLVATLPLYLNALTGRGVHLVTVNDYLARRDAETYGPVYDAMGLSVGIITNSGSYRYVTEAILGDDGKELAEHSHLEPIGRKDAYACDITYGTNNEFGFDYLRDNMAPSLDALVQRGLFFAIVDEVDSILIDEARTPLIISGPAEESADLYMQFAQLVPRLNIDEHYTVDEKDRVVSLTREGIARMEELLGVENIYSGGEMHLAYHLEEALKAQILFKRDKEYVVRDGEVMIVDEFTGRLMPGRRYSEGLHQAIEAKEGVKVQRESDTLATISFQNLFRLYLKLAGMTGTAKTEEEELMKIYGLEVIQIPTNRLMVRKDAPDKIYKTEDGKFKSVVAEVKAKHESGQPVLIGTVSIEKNEKLSEALRLSGVPHEILNAKNNEREASIIAQAGRKGAVTLATNLAGRGTDIMLGGQPPKRREYDTDAEFEGAKEDWQREHDQVLELGGLHVVGTERHESRRIDNQLRGRSGRQGDPGSSQFYISTEDDLMRIFGGERMGSWLNAMGVADDEAIEHKMISRTIESAQKKVEGHNFDMRKRVVEYDDVMNRHREVIYRRRRKALDVAVGGPEIEETVRNSAATEARRLTGLHASGYHSEWNLEQLTKDVTTILGLNDSDSQTLATELAAFQADNAVEQRVSEVFELALDHKKADMGQYLLPVLQSIYLNTINMLWVEHLNAMQELRGGVGLQGYAQLDPLVIYKQEGYRLFQQLLQGVDGQTMRTFFRVEKVEAVPVVSEPGQASVQG